METASPFDLNQEIKCWRENLGASPAFANENLDELETHLRDSIIKLQTPELSTEEAFIIAAKRLGEGGLLEREFTKVNLQAVWLDRVLWMLIGIQVWALVSNVLGRIVRGGMSFGLGATNYDFGAHGRVVPVTLFLFVQTVTFIGSLGLCWWLVVCKGPMLGDWIERHLRRRIHLALTGGLLWLFSTIALALSQIVQNLPHGIFAVSMAGELNMALAISTTILTVAQGLTLIALTLYLARKRLRLEPE